MRWESALPPTGQSAAGPFRIRVLLGTLPAPHMILLLSDRMRRRHRAGNLRPGAGLLFATRRYLAAAACREWPLSGTHFSKPYFRFWPVSDRAPAADRRSPLHFRLFGHFECVIDLDAEVSNGALELRMTEQELHCTQILRAAIDQRGFRASQCMGSIRGGVEADLPYPPADDPRVLPCRQMRKGMQAARKQVVLRAPARRPGPRRKGFACLLGDFELHRALGLLLHDDRAGSDVLAVRDVAY